MSNEHSHTHIPEDASPQYDLNGNSITAILIRRPTLVVVLFLVLGILGLFSYTQLSYELIPKVDPPVVTITTIYPGAAPNEVETSVVKEIEDAVSLIEGIDNMRSTSSEGIAFTLINFEQDQDIDQAIQNVQRKVNAIRANLPSDVEEPTIDKFALDELPILTVAVTADMSPKAFFDLMEDRVKPRLSKISGVGTISIVGGEEREIQVNVDAEKLKLYGLSIGQVSQTIGAYNLDVPTGNVKDQDGQYNVRVAGKFTSLEQLHSLVVAQSSTGSDITLGMIADVNDGIVEPTNVVRLNLKPAVGLFVTKQTDANAVAVSQLVRAEFETLKADYAREGLFFEVANDTSDFTIQAAEAVQHDLFLAIVLVALVMLVFLHSLRSSFIVMVALPASIISTFIAFYVFGFTLNLMTMLALSLVVGILVDDSIVVLENIYRHLEMGKSRRQAALDGRNEIGFTALSITLVDVVVFLPLGFVGGLVGGIISSYALVIVISTMISLLVSFTITPVMASRMAKLEHFQARTFIGRLVLGFEGWFTGLSRRYGQSVGWVVRSTARRWVITIGSLMAMIATMMFLVGGGYIGGEFFERSDRGEFSVIAELPLNAKLEQTNQLAFQVESAISDVPEVDRIFTNVGASNEGLIGSSSANVAELRVNLVPFEQRQRTTEQITSEIRRTLRERFPNVKARVTPIGFFGSADEAPIQLILNGPNYDSVLVAADRMLRFTQNIPGTSDVRLSTQDGKPELRVDLDRTKMADLGLTIAEVGASLRTALTGDDDSKYRDGTKDYDIRVRLDQFDRTRTEDVKRLTFLSTRGELIELQQFATVYLDAGPSKLERYNRSASITLSSQIVGVPSSDVSTAMINQMSQPGFLPGTVSYDWEGDVKNQSEGFGSLGLALLLAIIFMYLIMVALYNSYVYPFVVLFSLPVAIIGALFALALTNKPFSVPSILGIIMLQGLVAKNAILLVDFALKRMADGLSLKEAVAEAGRERLRPIVMTTFALIFGMMPIAIATGAGAEWKNGLAWALIGGLTTSMFLTLFVVPAAFVQTTATLRYVGRLFGRKRKGNDPYAGGGNGQGTEAHLEPKPELLPA
ncbi:MAG: efflux RND transporter permease subunit [Bacteroidia bacterium]|nr:efflux RND transporter permease subunit [Bacteroidia bacterium]